MGYAARANSARRNNSSHGSSKTVPVYGVIDGEMGRIADVPLDELDDFLTFLNCNTREEQDAMRGTLSVNPMDAQIEGTTQDTLNKAVQFVSVWMRRGDINSLNLFYDFDATDGEVRLGLGKQATGFVHRVPAKMDVRSIDESVRNIFATIAVQTVFAAGTKRECYRGVAVNITPTAPTPIDAYLY